MEAENQNFPQMTRIWLENRHLESRIIQVGEKLSLIRQCQYDNRCSNSLSEIFNLNISINPDRYSHLSENGGSKVVRVYIFTVYTDIITHPRFIGRILTISVILTTVLVL